MTVWADKPEKPLTYFSILEKIEKKTGDTTYKTIREVPEDGTGKAKRDVYDRILEIHETNTVSGVDYVVKTSYTYIEDSDLVHTETIQIDDGTQYTITYSYDTSSRIKTIQYPSGKILEYFYNTRGYVRRITFDGNGIVEYHYDPLGSIIGKNVGERGIDDWVLETINQYDYRGFRYTTETRGMGDLRKYEFSHFPDGRIDYIKNNLDLTRSKKYTYDNGYRLIGAQVGTLVNSGEQCTALYYDESYNYDLMGNLVNSDVDITTYEMRDWFDDDEVHFSYQINAGNWWEREGTLNTANTELSDIQLISFNRDIRNFNTIVTMTPGKVYHEPVVARKCLGDIHETMT